MKALRKDFFMEIRKSKARFISIFFIVALGVAFFSGIQAASPDMRFSGDAYYDEHDLMDIKVQGTMGLTDEDVQALEEISGIESAEGAFSTDVLCGDEDAQKVLHMESLNETVNQLTIAKGRIPETGGEIFLDAAFAQEMDYAVGDTITVIQEEDSELLLTEAFEVVGIGSSPLYISFARGNTTLGMGEIDGFAYVMPEDFDQEIYTQIYLRVHGAKGLISYTDGYDNLIDKIKERVEGIEEERCQIRYDNVVGEAEEELADGRKEYEDAKKEAEDELAEAEQELADAEQKLADAEQELADGKQEYEDGVQALEDAKQEIAEGRAQIADSNSQIASAQAELASAQAEVDAGWAELNPRIAQLEAGKEELAAAKAELASGQAQLDAARAALDEQQAQLDAGQAEIDSGRQQIESTRTGLNQQKQDCQNGLAEVTQGEAQLPELEAAINAAAAAEAEAAAVLSGKQQELENLQNSGASEEEIAAAQNAVNEAQANLNEWSAAVQIAQNTYSQAAGQLAATRTELEGAIAGIDAGLAELDAQEAALSEAETELASGQAQLDASYAQLAENEAAFEAQLGPAQEQIAAAEAEIAEAQPQVDAAKAQLEAGQAEINAGAAEIESAWAQVVAGDAELAAGEAEIAENEQKLADAKKEIEDGEKELEDGKKEYEDGKKEYEDGKKEAEEELADAEKELEDAQEEIDDLEVPEWIVSDRHNLPEYSDYGDNADRIRNIGQVFPVLFFLVAALVSLTTMTRMVEEQRLQIGTLKALGYGKYAIVSKYLNYAFLATVSGSVCGILVGEKILPYIIIKAYGMMYHNMARNLHIRYEWKFAMIASVAAVVCTIGATVFSCYRALAETPASLMRPPAPKEGKRVLVERIPFLWKRLSFTWKSTLRNLFRYKKRLFMTIFGIAGSMALMLVGFGIRDSIVDIAGIQYESLQHYDGTIIDDSDATDTQREELQEFLETSDRIDRFTHVQLTSMSVPREKGTISVYVYVPENLENFSEDVTLRDRRSGEEYQLTDEGAVISEKTSSLTGLKVGDMITITRDSEDYPVKIASITENYMGHYIYMSPSVYEETFHEKPDYTSIVFSMKGEYEGNLEELGNEILKYPAALSISYTRSIAQQLDRMLSTLSSVIVVLIVSAGMLAFVVLYNLNNINITERQRELATLKVLGFFDLEVSEYVFRENILLTTLGILSGIVMGIFLHRYVITTVEVDAVMFGRTIKWTSYLYSGLFTAGFSMIVNFFMHFKLKKIDMVESLKSVE